MNIVNIIITKLMVNGCVIMQELENTKINKLGVILILVIVVSSCSKPTLKKEYEIEKVEFIGYNYKNRIIYKEVFSYSTAITFNGDIINKYTNSNQKSSIFSFNLFNPISYLQTDTKKEIKFLTSRSYSFKNKDILVYKYYFDDDFYIDDTEIFFWCIEFGVFLRYSCSWNSFLVKKFLTKNENNELSNFLIDEISRDSCFFRAIVCQTLPPDFCLVVK